MVTVTQKQGFIHSDELVKSSSKESCRFVLKTDEGRTFSVFLWDLGSRLDPDQTSHHGGKGKLGYGIDQYHKEFSNHPLGSFNQPSNQSTCRKLFQIRDVISRGDDVAICSNGDRKKQLVHMSQSNVIEISPHDVIKPLPPRNFLVQFMGP